MIVLWGLSTVLLGWTFFRHLGALRTFLPEKSRFFNPSTLHINIQSDEASLQVVSYFLLFCAMAVPANLLAPLVSGLFFPGLINYRYFSSLIALPLIALPVILHFYHAKGLSYAWARIALPAVLIALCAAMIVMVPRSTRTVEQVRQITPSTAEAQLAECVDNYAETYDLKYGVSEYWMSYPVGFLSKKQTWVNPVCNNMSPCVALDADLYLHPPGVPDNTDIFAEKGYSFILITNGAQFQFTADIVKKSVPSPDKILPCRDGKSIWLYTTKRAVFNAGLETPFTKYLLVKGIADHAALPASQWFSLNDPLRLPLDTIRLDNRYPKGWGVAGMYEKLPVGKYQLQMKIRATSKKPDHVIATIGAGIVTAPIDPLQKHYEQQSFAKDIQRAPTPVTIDIEFEISRAASKEPWGIWSYYHGEGTVQITDVTLTRLRGTR
jgi:hypothetical protein